MLWEDNHFPERQRQLQKNFFIMDTLQKLEILSGDSQYDLACACGTKNPKEHRKRSEDGARWLYPVPLAAGGKGIMFKTLISNCCGNDCKYCPLRSNANARRCALTPDETVRAFLEQERRKHLIGLFLSSGVTGTPDTTMERLIASAEILRKRYSYKGYIHLKIIPGASEAAMLEALRYSTKVSLNIEVPGKRHFEKLSGCKNFERDIVAPLKFLASHTGRGTEFRHVQCSTQFIVGASDEKDYEILRYMDGIYNRLKFERVYFSAYQPGLGDPGIPGEQHFTLSSAPDKLTREHRLYQADFLLRKYHFGVNEMMYDAQGNFELGADPKQVWADRHPECFPVNANQAPEEKLLRVPGLGPVAVKRILSARSVHRLHALTDANLRGAPANKASKYLVFS